ncbi:MAG: hypothetical protein ABIQ52_03080 [Vicinamibacterales bacterium]
MNQYDDNVHDRDLALVLRQLDNALVVPEPDPVRQSALMAAFDVAHATAEPVVGVRQYWYMAALATAAAVLMAAGLSPVLTGRYGAPRDPDPATHMPLSSTPRGVQPGPHPPNEFVMVPGALTLPAMESGSLVRINVPVAMLPSLGITPPATSRGDVVTADLIVAQDGLPRAVRLVN